MRYFKPVNFREIRFVISTLLWVCFMLVISLPLLGLKVITLGSFQIETTLDTLVALWEKAFHLE